ncbi:LysR family transcriptional regulator [Fusobacterium simiae]|uniref:LysR family transcriptional regulator n=1 Tax=Fusobacterium simiae TaxID=855 RepID=A0ABT4DK48_FUSSI|nr:LysR family transcriptional regulator [Fusobacterium simiae]MCY7008957.1 LysR family transcriptional regulator [Fusobacterium simiae]
MDTRLLVYYLAIAEEENITKASQILHVTQPTLSRQMMQLEEELGVKLFIRSKHRIILTNEGMLFKQRAEEIISLIEKTKYEIDKKNQISGKIIIGSGEFLTFSYLAKVISKFKEEYPLVNFDIFSGNADSIKNKIENGLIDVGLLLTPIDLEKYNFLEIPSEEIWGVFVSEDSLLIEKNYVTKEDLLYEKIIMPKRMVIQNRITEWFGEDYKNLNIVGTYNLMGNAAVFVQEKLGVAIGLKRNYNYHQVYFLPLYPSITAKTILVWKKNLIISPILDNFLKYIKNTF